MHQSSKHVSLRSCVLGLACLVGVALSKDSGKTNSISPALSSGHDSTPAALNGGVDVVKHESVLMRRAPHSSRSASPDLEARLGSQNLDDGRPGSLSHHSRSGSPNPSSRTASPDLEARMGSLDLAKHELTHECVICMDSVAKEEVHRTPCGHDFHPACFTRWHGTVEDKTRERCARCRQPIQDRDPLLLEQWREDIYQKLEKSWLDFEDHANLARRKANMIFEAIGPLAKKAHGHLERDFYDLLRYWEMAADLSRWQRTASFAAVHKQYDEAMFERYSHDVSSYPWKVFWYKTLLSSAGKRVNKKLDFFGALVQAWPTLREKLGRLDSEGQHSVSVDLVFPHDQRSRYAPGLAGVPSIFDLHGVQNFLRELDEDFIPPSSAAARKRAALGAVA